MKSERRAFRGMVLMGLLLTEASAQTYTITTFAGGALPVNIPGISASLAGPQSAIANDASGNVFFADGNTVLRLDAQTGMLTLAAGNGTSGYSGDNGPAVSAQLRGTYGLAVDTAGNLYIASNTDHVVRKVSGGLITTIAGTGAAGFSGDNGAAANAQLNAPVGIAIDSSGSLYIADYGNNRIRQIKAGVITTVAGIGSAGFSGDNGPALSAQLNAPHGVAVDGNGNIYFADSGNHRIRKLSAGIIGTVAGNGVPGFSGDTGPATAAQVDTPCGIAIDAAGNIVIADYYNHRVRRVSNGVITTVGGNGVQGFAGDDGPAAAAQMNDPFVLTVDAAGNIFIADYGNNRIRRISSGSIVTVAGNGTAGVSGDGGPAIGAQLNTPAGIALGLPGNLYFADSGSNRVRGISNAVINTLAGAGTASLLSQQAGVAIDALGSLYVADTGNHTVRRISEGSITAIAGTGVAGFSGDSGPAVNARLNHPSGIAIDASGSVYIADSVNHRIRKVTGSTITTVAGTGTAGFAGDNGPAVGAQLNYPLAIAVDSSGALYIADSGNHRIRKVTAGVISTVAGTGVPGYSGDNASAVSARLSGPAGVAISNGTLFIADTMNNTIRRVANGIIATIAGGGTSFGDNGPATAAALAGPAGIAVDASGNIFISDSRNSRIRQLTPVPISITGPAVLPTGMVGTAFAATALIATGGAGSYTWSETGLPNGISLSSGGILTGTPTAAGTTSPVFTVKDSAQAQASVTLTLRIDPRLPIITTLAPIAAIAGGPGFTLTVNGSGFLAGAIIQWNETQLVTRFVSATQLTAPVTAAQIASPGNFTISVSSGGVRSTSVAFPVNPPTPTLSQVSPSSVTATGPGFNLTATGTGFVQSTQMAWNGASLQTTFVSATQLTATVPASLISSAGTAGLTANSGGTPSAALTFTIGGPPTVTSTSPGSVTAYSATFTLAVTGTGFASGSVIQWNNSPLATRFVSATQLTAPVPASLIGGAGSSSVVVASGGVSSAPFAFTINPQPPVVTSLVPSSATATGTAFTLTATGSAFTQTSTIQWNGTPLTTTFGDQTVLTAYVPAGLIASVGSATVLVSSGATSSAAVSFSITAPPVIATVSPASIVAGGPALKLTVNGTGFISGTQLHWNGAALATTFVSATQLTASISTALIAGLGSVSVTASNAGVSSNALTLSITGPPVIASLAPETATAGGPAFTLTVNGSGFVSAAVVTWNGTPLTSKFVSASQMTASVTASLIATAGVATIAVNAGGVSSVVSILSINAPPAISALNPATVAGTGLSFTLALTGSGFITGAAVQWNGAQLPTTFVSATQLTAAVPANLAVAPGNANIAAVNPGGVASATVKLPITASPPLISQGGVVPLYSSIPSIQAGSWISIYGTGLANGIYTWKGDYPTTLGGTTVKINNKAAYLWSVSPTQINLQAPDDTTSGVVNVVVTSPTGTTTSTVTLAPYGPSFSLLPASHYAAGVILTTNNSGAYGNGAYDLAGPAGQFAFSTRPVKPGETIELFGVGFGATAPAVPAGKAYSGAAPTAKPVTITIGGSSATVLFAGMTQSGVYQFNVVVPAVAAGNQTLTASVGGIQTPAGVLIAVQ